MKRFIGALIIVILITMTLASVFAVQPPTIGQQQLGSATGFINNILATIQFVGYAIAIGMLIYAGIRYVMAPANEKADLKNAMIKYVIGAILIAGAATIAKWIFAIGPEANTTPTGGGTQQITNPVPGQKEGKETRG